jgi:hypothetical protein
MAKERGYEAVAATLEPVRDRHRRALPTETGENHPIHLAAETGDLQRVREFLDAEPSLIRVARPNGRRLLTTAVEFGHESMVRFLLERGANPTWPEPDADKGRALHAAARAGNRAMVELLLSFGADPNGHADSAGNAVYTAKTAEIRALLEAHGGSLDPYDLVWKNEDDEVMRRVTADPKSAELGRGNAPFPWVNHHLWPSPALANLVSALLSSRAWRWRSAYGPCPGERGGVWGGGQDGAATSGD